MRADSPSIPRDTSTRPRSSSTSRIECSSDCNRRISATTSRRRDSNHSVEWDAEDGSTHKSVVSKVAFDRKAAAKLFAIPK